MPDLLEVDRLTAGYGEAVIIEDVSLALGEGASLALLGRNGVGKTTLLLTLMGLTRQQAGRIAWSGRDISKLPAFARARLGLGWVPQERYMFPSLTVDEHLLAVARPGAWNAAKIYELFPSLAERRRNRGNQLSGGEQQMLAIARALMVNPRLLLLDEPMEGLAPIVVQSLTGIVRRLLESGLAMILVEQHARLALSLATDVLVLDRGRVVHRSPSAQLAADPDALARLLSVA